MPKSRPSLNPLCLLGDSWSFARKQPVLWDILLWLLVLPAILLSLFDAYWPESEIASNQQIGQIGYGLAQVLIAFVSFWGFCCVLLVGRRQIVNRAGRSRTSFRSVRRESLRLIIPVFVTSLLRSFGIFYWSLLYILAAGAFVFTSALCHDAILNGVQPFLHALDAENALLGQRVLSRVLSACGTAFLLLPLLLPAVLYALRTIFFPVAVAADDLRYREALRRSRQIIRGKFWATMSSLVGLSVLVFVPAYIVTLAMELLPVAAPWFDVVRIVIEDSANATAAFFFTLASIQLYGKLSKGKKDGPEEVIPGEM